MVCVQISCGPFVCYCCWILIGLHQQQPHQQQHFHIESTALNEFIRCNAPTDSVLGLCVHIECALLAYVTPFPPRPFSSSIERT